MDTRLGRAIKASNELITNLHRDGLDRGCIATFNDSLTIRQVKPCSFLVVLLRILHYFIDSTFVFFKELYSL